jgi:hypothetical protein
MCIKRNADGAPMGTLDPTGAIIDKSTENVGRKVKSDPLRAYVTGD